MTTSAQTRPVRLPLGEAELFQRAGAGDPVAREALVRRFTPLARSLARRYASGSGMSDEDLEQVALMGLVKAIDRFEPEQGFAFSSFATPTILGEVRRSFRSSWSVHLPRGLQEDTQRVTKALRDLEGRLGRSPTVAELEEATGLTTDRVLDAMGASRNARPRSLDAPAGTGEPDDPTVGDQQGVHDGGYDFIDVAASAAAVTKTLDERTRKILHLRFIEDLTQDEIARQVGISQMQVSRILSRTIRLLRAAVDADERAPAD